MSGHNRWSKVKHVKAKMDAQKGKAFTKVVREIVVAARAGGGDPSMNAALRLAVQKAKDVNMPNDNVKRAIEKGVGGGDAATLEKILYEVYAPGGVAVLVEALTDNRNRTASNVRMVVSKGGGNMAAVGAVSYIFEKRGVILFEPGVSSEEVMELVIEAGADDVDVGPDGSIAVETAPENFEKVREALDKAKMQFLNAEITMVPKTEVVVDEDVALRIQKLIDNLENDEDVQAVYANFTQS